MNGRTGSDDEQRRRWIREHHLTTAEAYYGFMAQGNTFAPEFSGLVDSVQEQWRVEFAALQAPAQ